MKLTTHFLILLIALIWRPCFSIVDSHCRRYRACLSSSRSDYELCVGGIAAGIVADYEEGERADILLKHSGAVAECENRNFVKIMEYKAIRRLEEDDIIKCSENANSDSLSEMKKLACIGTPVTWSLQDLARGSVQRPSQCRELFLYQLERCAFLSTCCPAHSVCMSNITAHSLAYQQRIQRGYTINDATKKCLESLNYKYNSPSPLPENEVTSTDSIPGFKQPISQQQKRIEEAVSEARASITATTKHHGDSTVTTTARTTVATLPTFPTLPTLPNLLHVLFPGLTSTTPRPTTTTTTAPTTTTLAQTTTVKATEGTVAETDLAKKPQTDSDFAKDEEGPEAEKKKMRLTIEENKKLCQEALRCESRLRGYKLECGKKHIEELKNPLSRAAYTDLLILKELLRNIDDSEATPAVRKACILPILGNFTDPLTNLLNEMEVKHSACTEKSTFYKKSIDPDEKEKCLAISTDIIFEEMSFENGKLRNSGEKGENESFEKCVAKIEFASKKCNEAKNCCPGYRVCTKLMLESDAATKYNETLKKVKDIQKKCEMETVSNLTSVRPGFVPYFQ